MILESLDGRAFAGASLADALDRMRDAAWGCPGRGSRLAYMRRVAERVMQWNKAYVRSDTIEGFIDDMERAGLLTIRRVQ